MTTGVRRKDATITAQAMFTDPIPVHAGEQAVAIVDGTGFTATVTPQIRFPPSTTWFDFGSDTMAAVGFKAETAPAAAEFRAGVKTGGFTSGTLTVTVKAGG